MAYRVRMGDGHGWRIGSLAGVPVYLGRSWVLVALLMVLLFGPTVRRVLPDLGPAAYAVALVFALLLLVSVLVHEAAHALVAQAVGFRVGRIVADFWGGHTAHDGAGSTPGRSAAVAVVGPLSNGLLALLGWWLTGVIDGGVPWLLAYAFTAANAFVTIFNSVPALPLDGGFLLEALVWKVSGNRHLGTMVAGWMGRLLVVLLLIWAFFPVLSGAGQVDLTRAMWVGLICLFLWQGASQAIASGRTGVVTSRRRLGEVAREVGVVRHDQPLSTVAWGSRPLWVVTGPAGAPEGVVDPATLDQVPAADRASTPASAVAIRLADGWAVPLSPEDSLESAVEVMRRTRSGVVGLLDEAGAPWGVVLVDDVTGGGARRARLPG